MSDTKDLRDLLDRLRSETGPLPPETGAVSEPAQDGSSRPARSWGKPGAAFKQYRLPEAGTAHSAPVNPVWSENKEIMLFGMLAALVAALGGILAGLEYLVVAGAAVFSMFALVLSLALLRVTFIATRRGPEGAGLAERVDALSKRVELLSSRAAAAVPRAQGGAPASDRELEQKVEELRVLMRSLAKAVEGSNK